MPLAAQIEDLDRKIKVCPSCFLLFSVCLLMPVIARKIKLFAVVRLLAMHVAWHGCAADGLQQGFSVVSDRCCDWHMASLGL